MCPPLSSTDGSDTKHNRRDPVAGEKIGRGRIVAHGQLAVRLSTSDGPGRDGTRCKAGVHIIYRHGFTRTFSTFARMGKSVQADSMESAAHG